MERTCKTCHHEWGRETQNHCNQCLDSENIGKWLREQVTEMRETE